MKILVPEEIPSHNKGEMALMLGLIESFRPLGNHQFRMFSPNPELDQINYAGLVGVVDARGVIPKHMLDGQWSRAAKISSYAKFVLKHLTFALLYMVLGSSACRLMRRELWQSYLWADILLVAHDSSFNTTYHCTLALFAKAIRRPCIIYAATIKPPHRNQRTLKNRCIDRFLCFCLKCVDLISLRESMSLDYLEGLGMDSRCVPTEVLPDLAFLSPSSPASEIDEIAKREKIPRNDVLIGMAISRRKLDFAFPGQRDLTREDRHEKALGHIIRLVDYLTEKLEAWVVFIPHSIGPTPVLDDRRMAATIRDRAKDSSKILIIGNEYGAAQLKGLAGLMNMTISTRLHFTIDSVCMRVPSLLITHNGDIRCHGIIGVMFDQHEYVYNIDNIESETLIGSARCLWENRQVLSKDLSEKVSKIRQQTYKHGELAKGVYDKYHCNSRN